MFRKTIITLSAFAFLLISCKTQNKDISWEKNILTEIIPSIVDSICQDPRVFLSPPPMLGKFRETADGRTIIDTSLATAIQKTEYKIWLKKRDSLKTDTSKIILTIDPKIMYTEDLEIDFVKHFKGKRLLNSPKNKDSSYTLNLKVIKLNKPFMFKYRSEFPKNLNIWNKKYDFIFSGVFSVSRILFDESKNYGVLSASYICGGLCGEGYLIYIKKIKDKWIIDKIKGTWIS